MSLEDLKKLESEAACLDSRSRRSYDAASTLAKYRNGNLEMSEVVKNAFQWSFGPNEEAREAMLEVINEMKVDILRIAELRLSAKARTLKVQAAQRRAVLTASILPVPGIESGKAGDA